MINSENVMLVSLLKVTLFGVLLWCGHFALIRTNPRWRMGLWRAGSIGLVLLLVSLMVPPLLPWRVQYEVEFSRPQPVVQQAPPEMSRPIQRDRFSGGRATAPFPSIPESALLPPSASHVSATVPSPSENDAPIQKVKSASTVMPTKQGPWIMAISFEVIGILLYLLVTIGLSIRFCIGLQRASRLVRNSNPAQAFVMEQVSAYCSQLKIREPRVVSSTSIRTPSMVGCRRPVVLLPESILEQGMMTEDLRAGLAHELAHVAGNDLLWDRICRVLSILLWGHPLFWKIPAVHRSTCEHVRDQDAAELAGDREKYRSSLARLALHALRSPSPALLLMASQPEILGRLEALAKGQLAPALGTRGWLSGVAALFLAVVLGTSTVVFTPIAIAQPVSPAVPIQEKPAPPVEELDPNRPLEPFELTILKAEDDTPLADVQIRFWYNRNLEQNLKTDGNGKVTLQWPEPEKRSIMLKSPFQFSTKSPGRVPYYALMGNLSLDNLPRTKTIRIQRGTIIGGVIEDEQGNPVEGATVSITVPATDTVSTIHYHLFEETTGSDGRWELDSAPEPVTSLGLRIEHPRFPRTYQTVQTGRDARYRIEAGWSIQGTITDQKGQPVENAIVHVGHDRFGSGLPEAETDAKGHYELFGLAKKDTMLTVSSLTNAPQMKDVVFEDRPATADFQLEPGHQLKVKIVDPDGKPITKASLHPDTWRGHRTVEWKLKADENGEIFLAGAPSDGVDYDLLCEGYSALRDQVLVARAESYVLTMQPVRKFDVTVLDAQSGASVPEITAKFGSIFPGRKDVYWMDYSGAGGRDGKLHLTYGEPNDPLFLKVEAVGYQPWISQALPKNLTSRSFVVMLAPGVGPSGQIVTPKNEPAQNAEIHVVTASQGMQFSGSFDPHGGIQHVKADKEGKFQLQSLDNPDEATLLVIVHDSGYLELPLDQLKAGQPIQLAEWAKLEITLKDGHEPVKNGKVVCYVQPPKEQKVKIFSYGLRATTDDLGVAILDHCPPLMTARVGREIEIDFGTGGSSSTIASGVKVEFKPGETTRVTIGGKGREVLGQIVMPPDPPVPHSWKLNEFGRFSTVESDDDSPEHRSYSFTFNSDGTFRVPDVKPGKYRLSVRLTGLPNPGQCGSGPFLGMIQLPFEVTDQPGSLDLGKINGEWERRLRVGDPSPDFVGFNADRKVVRAADYNGKWLVLDFWAMWCGPCLTEMPLMQEFADRFEKSSDGKVNPLAVSLDQDFSAAVKLAQDRRCRWPQLRGESQQSAIAKAFNVEEIPVKFLIDPNGIVRYRGNSLGELSAVLDLLLLQETNGESSTAPAAMPVVHPDRIRSTAVDDQEFQPSNAEAGIACYLSNFYQRDGSKVAGEFDRGLKLVSQDGTAVRQLPDLLVEGWLTRPDRIAADQARGRIYCCDSKAEGTLVAIDQNGRRLFDVAIPRIGAVAVDEKTGDIWCLIVPMLNQGHLVVLDQNGNEKTRYPESGFTLRYSPSADAFWLVGRSAKLIDRDGTIREQADLPMGAYTFSAVAVDDQGGCWVVECSHPDVPGSHSRVWHFDRQAQPLACVELESNPAETRGDFPNWIESVGDECWVGIRSITNAGETETCSVRRLTREGATLGVIDLAARAAGVTVDQKFVWLLCPGECIQVDLKGQKLKSIVGPKVPSEGYFSAWMTALQ